jgi:tetratricopeptide (TPR) repeat protein
MNSFGNNSSISSWITSNSLSKESKTISNFNKSITSLKSNNNDKNYYLNKKTYKYIKYGVWLLPEMNIFTSSSSINSLEQQSIATGIATIHTRDTLRTIEPKNPPKKLSHLEYKQIQDKKLAAEEEVMKNVKYYQKLIKERPKDFNSVEKLISLLYEQKNYLGCQQQFNRYVKNDNSSVTSEIYIKIGKCCFRNYLIDGSIEHLIDAKKNYLKALSKPSTKRNNDTPIPYFEVAGILLRLGEYQGALDAFSVINSLYKEDRHFNWNMLSQYNVAQILLTRGNLKLALQTYRSLACVCPISITCEPGLDHIISVSISVTSLELSLEMARLIQRTGDYQLAKDCLNETFNRMWNQRNNGGHEEDDFMYEYFESKFIKWYNDYTVYQRIADYFKSRFNLVMAAEFYGYSAEVFSNNYLPIDDDDDNVDDKELLKMNKKLKQRKILFLSLLLKRGECLLEYHSYDEAAFCGRFVYTQCPFDVVIVGKAAKLCSGRPEENRDIIDAGRHILDSVYMLQRALDVTLKWKMKRERDMIYHHATAISSFIRMVLTRNRTVGDRLGWCSATRITSLRYNLRRKCLKSGKEQFEFYIQIWNHAAVIIQNNITHWRRSRKFSVFLSGIATLKRIVRGQMCRIRLRNHLNKVQEILDNDPSINERQKLQDNEKYFVGINFLNVGRISSGIVCSTADEGRYDLSQNSTANNVLSLKSRKIRITPKNANLDIFESSMKKELISNKKKISSIKQNNNNNFIKSKSNPSSSQTSRRNTSRSQSKPETNRDSKAGENKKGNKIELPSDSVESKTSGLGVTWFKSQEKSYMDKKSTGKSNLNNESKKNLNKLSNKKNNYNNNNKLLTNNTSMSKSSNNIIDSPMKSTKSVQESLDEDLRNSENNGEDIMSLISCKSVNQDNSVQWIPFGIIPDIQIKHLLTCTSLAITSSSFSMNDSKRLCVEAKKNTTKLNPNLSFREQLLIKDKCLWDNLKSLFIYGTKMGPSGIKSILKLGIGKLESLSLGYIGISHHCGKIIGSQLINLDKYNPNSIAQNIPNKNIFCCLSKLYIEGELGLGDRGCVELFNCLHYNNTIRLISIRACGVGKRTAVSCSKFVGINQSLEVLILNDNIILWEEILKLIRCMANKGSKGRLKSISIKNQTPPPTKKQLFNLYKCGTCIGVRIISDNLSAEDETELEMNSSVDIDYDEINALNGTIRDFTLANTIEKGSVIAYQKHMYI